MTPTPRRRRTARAPATATWAILVASAMVSFGQTTKTGTSPDTWQRSKECAAQAEKVVTEARQGSGEFVTWTSHYSPKYDRCFIEIRHMFTPLIAIQGKPVLDRDHPVWIGTELQDAFERLRMAYVFSAASRQPCNVEGESMDCVKAQNFIAEHMKN